MKAVRSKIPFRLNGCTKVYPKSYMKTHQESKIHNPLARPDTTASDAVINANPTDEAVSGETQKLISIIEQVDNDKALEAEIEVFDKLGELPEGDKHVVSIAALVITPQLIENEVGFSEIYLLCQSVSDAVEDNYRNEELTTAKLV